MKRVLLLLAEGFEVLEASAFIDVIGWNLVDGDHSTELKSCGLRKEINSAFHQKFIVDHLIEDIQPDNFDALAIPGGFEEYGFYTDAYDERFTGLIRSFHQQQKSIASICVGALPLGKSGILQGRQATTYNGSPKRLEMLKEFGVEVLNQPIVKDLNIITSWNPSTAVDVALYLLESLTSKDNALYIRKIMGFDRKETWEID
ncbi:MAG: DJ-1/PfpI family protein [Bacteroidales bacterium]|nr:DJ-1/PfpI family protein [Bacteroidales bacterium]